MKKNKTIKTFVLFLLISTLFYFQLANAENKNENLGEEIELNSSFMARSNPNFIQSANNKVDLLPNGTKGYVLETKILPSGNKGIKIRVSTGDNRSNDVWIYYNLNKKESISFKTFQKNQSPFFPGTEVTLKKDAGAYLDPEDKNEAFENFKETLDEVTKVPIEIKAPIKPCENEKIPHWDVDEEGRLYRDGKLFIPEQYKQEKARALALKLQAFRNKERKLKAMEEQIEQPKEQPIVVESQAVDELPPLEMKEPLPKNNPKNNNEEVVRKPAVMPIEKDTAVVYNEIPKTIDTQQPIETPKPVVRKEQVAKPAVAALLKDVSSTIRNANTSNPSEKEKLLINANSVAERALRIDPNFAQTYLIIAEIRKMQGKVEEAVQMAKKGLSKKPGPKTEILLRNISGDF